MNRLPETVSNKFSELFSVMNTATDDLKMAGADALLLGDFAQVGNITDACRQLQMLEVEINEGHAMGGECDMEYFDGNYMGCIIDAAGPVSRSE